MMLFNPEKIKNNLIGQNDLEEVIDRGYREDCVTEYKSRPNALDWKIAKSISSFANSDGGIIIYGINTVDDSCEVGGKPVKIIPIREVGVEKRVKRIANTLVDPAIKVAVCPIKARVRKKKGKCFVIYVPSSNGIKHKILHKNRYYVRRKSTSIPIGITIDLESG